MRLRSSHIRFFCNGNRGRDGLQAVNAAAEHGNVSAARAKFQEILAASRPKGSKLRTLANTVLKAYVKAGDPEGAISWVKVMKDDLRCSFNARSTGKLLESAALAKRPDLAEKWLTAFWPPGNRSSFAWELSLGLPVDDAAVSILALSLCRSNLLDPWRSLCWLLRWHSDMALEQRRHCQAAVLAAWAQVDDTPLILSLLEDLSKKGDVPADAMMDVVSYNSLADGCAKKGDLPGVHRWISKIEACGMSPNVVSFNIVIGAYAQQGRLLEASRWLGRMLEYGVCPNVLVYTTMISACARRGETAEAEEWLWEMHRLALEPVEATYNALLNGYAKSQNSQRAAQWLECMEANDIKPSNVSYTTIIDGFAREGDVDQAVLWFERLLSADLQADLIAGNAVLSAYASRGDAAKAMQWLHNMEQRNIQPDVVSYNTVIKGHARNHDPAAALEWLETMQRQKFEPNLISYNTVVAAYAQAGDPDSVAEVLERMSVALLEPSVVTWTSMINACANCQPRRGVAAQKVFQQMLQSGVQPNKVTLQALGRALGFQRQRAFLQSLGWKLQGDGHG